VVLIFLLKSFRVCSLRFSDGKLSKLFYDLCWVLFCWFDVLFLCWFWGLGNLAFVWIVFQVKKLEKLAFILKEFQENPTFWKISHICSSCEIMMK
jgi:hypothetical protein